MEGHTGSVHYVIGWSEHKERAEKETQGEEHMRRLELVDTILPDGI